MELPASFIDYTRALLGDEEYDKLAVAIQQEPPVSIRLNDGKLKIENGKCRIVPQAGCITDFQLSAFNYLIKGIDDTLEVRNLQSSTTNQATVYVRVSKQFFSIRRLAASTIKD